MSTVAFARILRDELETDLKTIEQGILGGAKDFEEYRFMTGKRWGLIQALAALDETMKRFDEAGK